MKDMPWYMKEWYSGANRTAGYEIIEPYICIGCGKRIDKVLERGDYSEMNSAERAKEFAAIRKRYKKYLKPRAVVEDMINNILLVKDAHLLNMLEEQRGLPHRGCGTSTTMPKTDEELSPKLEVQNEVD